MSFLDRLENKISPTTPTVDEPSVSTEPEKMSYLDRLREKTNKTEENVLLGNEPLRVSGKLKMDDLEKIPNIPTSLENTWCAARVYSSKIWMPKN